MSELIGVFSYKDRILSDQIEFMHSSNLNYYLRGLHLQI